LYQRVGEKKVFRTSVRQKKIDDWFDGK